MQNQVLQQHLPNHGLSICESTSTNFFLNDENLHMKHVLRKLAKQVQVSHQP